MSKDLKLNKTGASSKLPFLSESNPVQNILKKLRNQVKLDKTEKLWFLFLYIFEALVPKFLSAGETGQEVMSPCSFGIFLIFFYFLRHKSNVSLQLMWQLVDKVSYTRDQARFYLRWMTALKLWKAPNIMNWRWFPLNAIIFCRDWLWCSRIKI